MIAFALVVFSEAGLQLLKNGFALSATGWVHCADATQAPVQEREIRDSELHGDLIRCHPL